MIFFCGNQISRCFVGQVCENLMKIKGIPKRFPVIRYMDRNSYNHLKKFDNHFLIICLFVLPFLWHKVSWHIPKEIPRFILWRSAASPERNSYKNPLQFSDIFSWSIAFDSQIYHSVIPCIDGSGEARVLANQSAMRSFGWWKYWFYVCYREDNVETIAVS